jgi:hypothetical protein
MPLVNGNGPTWSRGLVARTEQRLAGLNPVRSFFASLFRRRRKALAGLSRRGAGPEDGPAGAGATAPLVPPAPTLTARAAKQLGSE